MDDDTKKLAAQPAPKPQVRNENGRLDAQTHHDGRRAALAAELRALHEYATTAHARAWSGEEGKRLEAVNSRRTAIVDALLAMADDESIR